MTIAPCMFFYTKLWDIFQHSFTATLRLTVSIQSFLNQLKRSSLWKVWFQLSFILWKWWFGEVLWRKKIQTQIINNSLLSKALKRNYQKSIFGKVMRRCIIKEKRSANVSFWFPLLSCLDHHWFGNFMNCQFPLRAWDIPPFWKKIMVTQSFQSTF